MGGFRSRARLSAIAFILAASHTVGAIAAPFATPEPITGPITGTISTKPTTGIFSPSGAPEIFCSNPMADFPGPFDWVDLVNNGCISGASSAYVNTDTGLPDASDDFYVNPGDYEEAVETQIMLATGRWVEMTLAVKLDDPTGSGRLYNAALNIDIQYWIENGGKQILWLMGANALQFDYMTIKGGNSYVLWDIRNNSFAGRYSTESLNNPKNSQTPGISHVVFWKADPITEPATLALLGLGAGAIALGRRRRLSKIG